MMCLTLFTSHPSDSMLTLTMQRTCSPGMPLRPTVLTMLRSATSLPFSASNTPESTWIVTQWSGSSSGFRSRP